LVSLAGPRSPLPGCAPFCAFGCGVPRVSAPRGFSLVTLPFLCLLRGRPRPCFLFFALPHMSRGSTVRHFPFVPSPSCFFLDPPIFLSAISFERLISLPASFHEPFMMALLPRSTVVPGIPPVSPDSDNPRFIIPFRLSAQGHYPFPPIFSAPAFPSTTDHPSLLGSRFFSPGFGIAVCSSYLPVTLPCFPFSFALHFRRLFRLICPFSDFDDFSSDVERVYCPTSPP